MRPIRANDHVAMATELSAGWASRAHAAHEPCIIALQREWHCSNLCQTLGTSRKLMTSRGATDSRTKEAKIACALPGASLRFRPKYQRPRSLAKNGRILTTANCIVRLYDHGPANHGAPLVRLRRVQGQFTPELAWSGRSCRLKCNTLSGAHVAHHIKNACVHPNPLIIQFMESQTEEIMYSH